MRVRISLVVIALVALAGCKNPLVHEKPEVTPPYATLYTYLRANSEGQSVTPDNRDMTYKVIKIDDKDLGLFSSFHQKILPGNHVLTVHVDSAPELPKILDIELFLEAHPDEKYTMGVTPNKMGVPVLWINDAAGIRVASASIAGLP